MGDEIDPCECLWGHEMAMRRLLSLLRQSQSHCTDTECFEDVSGLRNQQTQDGGLILICLFVVFALVMHYMRPRNSASKPQNNFGGLPRDPPPTTS